MKKNYFKLIVCLFLLVQMNAWRAQVTTQTVAYTGSVQTWTVPSCVNSLTIQLYGAQGASMVPGGNGGLGGYVSGVISVTPGQVLNIYVGGQNGYNGGGIGGVNGNAVGGGPTLGIAANGGGASDVRIGGIALANRVMVAGGGGGGAREGTWTGCQPASPAGAGGAGGGLTGGNGLGGSSTACNCTGGGGNGGQGGTQAVGGSAGTYNNMGCLQTWSVGSAGSLGQGGNGSTAYHNGTGGGGGGGGGYYGGGSGASGSDTTPGGGGGGGSNYTGAATSTVNTQGVQSGNGVAMISYLSNGSMAVNPTSTTICGPQSVTIAASGMTNYTWSPGNQNTSSIVVTPTASASYTVVGTNTLGCTATVVANVNVGTAPSLSVTGNMLICGTGTNVLTASGANSYTWSNGPTTSTVSLSPTVTTNYTVVGTNTTGCSSSSVVSMVVSTNPSISVNSGTVCAGQAFSLSPTGATNYTFQGGNAVVTPTANASYTVVGSNTAGCVSNMATSNITVAPSPSVNAVSSNTGVICAGQSVTLTASGGAATYSWANGGATTAVIVVSPSVTTTYTVIGTWTVNACQTTAMLTQSVSSCAGFAELTAAPSVKIYPNPSSGEYFITLDAASSVTLFDMQGKVIYQREHSAGNILINIKDQPRGLYFLKTENSSGTSNTKLIKE